MAFFSRSRLFGILLISASLPFDAAAALATGLASQPSVPDAPPPAGETAASLDARLRRIAAAVRERQGHESETAEASQAAEAPPTGLPADALARVFVNGPGIGWVNGGFRNGGFRNGGFYNGGFRNGGFYNGGFRNGGFRNGGWFNGNSGWRNHW
ncbi:rSAM-associated Gly-rich repeat protein [Vulcanococcus limneticus Candia 3F8]|uniref:GrrA/OscA1 family cyclophane-containing rSAM-modified RiPP n=1 Tax=Vulcanococcus limneticus TaxID=2170428 RepID=UPI000B987879|nr:GrrA/OscA1 family cyclophane-containing rSAM-modified RiPP [Vulcanococcus limneticus]MCP9792223.1 rSAM-associated Gly-rich repeat protein [Vulcanococcus limneticus MW73D5]MCP9894405.1 rSAM-associated Gly-rich repeat protein [Vulcanococcus limneticus Candia 3F8]MCP9897586.1 rSAM-associated Gly-rich repeat protein [Vulcanococcus limneticus Candia 3B3]